MDARLTTAPFGVALFTALAVFAAFQAAKRPPAPPVKLVKVRVVKPVEDRIPPAALPRPWAEEPARQVSHEETRFDHWRGREYRQPEAR